MKLFCIAIILILTSTVSIQSQTIDSIEITAMKDSIEKNRTDINTIKSALYTYQKKYISGAKIAGIGIGINIIGCITYYLLPSSVQAIIVTCFFGSALSVVGLVRIVTSHRIFKDMNKE